MGLEQSVRKLAKVALVVGGIAATVYLTSIFVPYSVSTYTPLVAAATGGAGAGYVVGSSTNSK